jgi:ornithine cyclodeaminase
MVTLEVTNAANMAKNAEVAQTVKGASIVQTDTLASFRSHGTLFLSAPEMAELVKRKGVHYCLEVMCNYIEQDFSRWQDFDKSARVVNHSKDGVIELMPISDASLYSFKYVNGHPSNTQQGLSTVMAFGVLADVDSGAPLLLSELTLTTALRTAAMSALAAKYLARKNSRVMALIGNGAQSEFQALAFAHLVGIEELRFFDIDPAATQKLVKNLQGINLQGKGLKITVCTSTREAVRGADIVTTVTADKAYATIITADMVAPGMHLNAVGGDCPGKTELDSGILQGTSDYDTAVFVEYTPQSRVEGEIQHLPADFAVTEMWQVIKGEKAGRTSDAQVTVFDSVGFALEDYAALRFVYDTARILGMGERISLIPQLDNPKDLFGLLY